MGFTKRIFIVVMALSIAQLLYYYPKLPDTIVSHYGSSGHPNGWMSKNAFFISYIALLVFFSLLIFGLPALIKRVPKSMVAMPKPEYWLAPERINRTMLVLVQWIDILGSVTLAFLICCFQLTISANLSETGLLSAGAFWFVFFAYMVFVGVWTVGIIKRFKRVED